MNPRWGPLHLAALLLPLPPVGPTESGTFLSISAEVSLGIQVPVGAQWFHGVDEPLLPALSFPRACASCGLPNLPLPFLSRGLKDALPAKGWTCSLFRHLPAPARSVQESP